ncbi:phosphate transport system substrate-binding protein [Vibrio xiamenensis]|uniref:Phosphate-binding protein n=1 Tax=Vibrio xiamenensis TaxID=861298 RepID=A0A1G8G7A0_9VIBR|nr:phosphate ABC transporter substrate-binding protein [Vibrio xiamenensis]SDH90180.1 phosphate transport system substrate-binding protein [Vibrio xiamenensis]
MLRKALAGLALWSLTASAHVALAEEINVSGSTSVSRVMDVLAEDYNAMHPGSFVAVQGVGSTAGIALLKKGVADIGMSSRYLTEGEESDNLVTFNIAFDGLAVVVNQANEVTNVSREQLYDIYKGKITNWKQLGGADQKIAVVTREASSGSRYSFESLLGLTRVLNGREVSDISPNNLVVNSNSMVKTLVNHNKQAIGFISMGSVDRSVKAMSFEGVAPSNKSIASGEYQLSRPFMILYLDDKIGDQEKAFLEYLHSDKAKQLIAEYGYIAVKK